MTKFGSKGIVNSGKAVPVTGGLTGGGFGFAETKCVANSARKMFIAENLDEETHLPEQDPAQPDELP